MMALQYSDYLIDFVQYLIKLCGRKKFGVTQKIKPISRLSGFLEGDVYFTHKVFWALSCLRFLYISSDRCAGT